MNWFYKLTGYDKGERHLILPFVLVASLFFLWALLHNMNPVLIPHLRKACQLSDAGSALIDSSVYLAYFLVALPAGLFVRKFSYKAGIMMGLLLYGIGTLGFLPAAQFRSYPLFLGALFVIASGATFLETVANPYIAGLGKPSHAVQRLNLAQSLNGFGSFVAPLLGGLFILSGVEYSESEIAALSPSDLNAYLEQEAGMVKLPYLIITLLVFFVMWLIWRSRIPDLRPEDQQGPASSVSSMGNVWSHQLFRQAVIAQFFYVGAQVGVGSFFIRYAGEVGNVSEKNAAFIWGSIAMVGFLLGRVAGTFLMRTVSATLLLSIFALACLLLNATCLLSSGMIAVYALAAIPFFMSIMFPTIFALGISPLKEEAKIGASFLIMSIIGGAVFPLMMGYISDRTHQIQWGYVVPLVCFAAVLAFAVSAHRSGLKTQ